MTSEDIKHQLNNNNVYRNHKVIGDGKNGGKGVWKCGKRASFASEHDNKVKKKEKKYDNNGEHKTKKTREKEKKKREKKREKLI